MHDPHRQLMQGDAHASAICSVYKTERLIVPTYWLWISTLDPTSSTHKSLKCRAANVPAIDFISCRDETLDGSDGVWLTSLFRAFDASIKTRASRVGSHDRIVIFIFGDADDQTSSKMMTTSPLYLSESTIILHVQYQTRSQRQIG